MQSRAIELSGIPKTMLWTLHNRASESMRSGGILRDPDAERIYHCIDFDFAAHFGPPDGTHALRSKYFDQRVSDFMRANPRGTVVELGCGLETQFLRVDEGNVEWVCVDVPGAIRVRERYLNPSERCRHVSKSALDATWMDEVDGENAVFVSAQGLFMYFEPADVRRLVRQVIERFPGVEIMFDAIPVWFSQKTLRGLFKTSEYKAPPMPWGVNRADIEPTLRNWSGKIRSVDLQPLGYFRGAARVMLALLSVTPGLREILPQIVFVRTRSR